jgi:hypothetical protein
LPFKRNLRRYIAALGARRRAEEALLLEEVGGYEAGPRPVMESFNTSEVMRGERCHYDDEGGGEYADHDEGCNRWWSESEGEGDGEGAEVCTSGDGNGGGGGGGGRRRGVDWSRSFTVRAMGAALRRFGILSAAIADAAFTPPPPHSAAAWDDEDNDDDVAADNFRPAARRRRNRSPMMLPGPVTEGFARSRTNHPGPVTEAFSADSKPGPVTEGFGGDGGGMPEESIAARLAAARNRGALNQQNAAGGAAAQGRAFASLMSAGASYGAAQAQGGANQQHHNNNGGHGNGGGGGIGMDMDLGAGGGGGFGGAGGGVGGGGGGMGGLPGHAVGSPGFDSVGPGMGYDSGGMGGYGDTGQIDMATGQPIVGGGGFISNNGGMGMGGGEWDNQAGRAGAGGQPARLGLNNVAMMATGQSKTQDLAKGMMQRLEARRLQKLTIQPIYNSDAMALPMTEDFALPHIGVVVRGGASANKKKLDGVPDRDVIVSNPIKLKERPKHKLQKVAQQKISGGDPPPVYMKHRSLFLFAPQNSFRRVVFMVVFDKKFEYIILLFILVSSAALAVDNPSVTPDSDLGQSLLALDVALNVIFFVEFAAKVIAMGFVLHPGAYLRSGWNMLDGFIVLTSVSSILFNDPRLTIVRSFRMMRALRPLRMIRRLRGMQLVVATLVQSMPQVMNVIAFGLFEFVIFGILGVQLFGGKFWRCTDPSVGHMNECVGMFQSTDGVAAQRKWVNAVYNFDHIFQAMMSLFVVATMDKWFDIAHRGVDVTEVDFQPVEENNPFNVLYFVAFVILASFFWVNLLVGAIIDNYRRISTASGDMIFTTAGQKRWAEALKMKQKQNTDKEEMVRVEPKFFIRKYIFRLVHHRYFEFFIMFCIFMNIFIMVLQHDGQPASLTSYSETLSTSFTWIFVFEMLLKIVALLPKKYWRDPWNRFDFFIVVGSIPEMFGLDMGPGTTVFRTFRMGRMFKMLQNAKGLRALFAAMINSAGALANVGSLLFLLMFIYSVLGMNLFGELEHGQFINEYNNFQNFGNGLLLLFRIFSGDAWSQIMVDTLGCDLVEGFQAGDYTTGCRVALAPPLFFISFIFLASFMLLNMFVAIILDKFIDSAQAEGLLSTASFFDALQRKMLLDGFMEKLKARLDEHRQRMGLAKKGLAKSR